MKQKLFFVIILVTALTRVSFCQSHLPLFNDGDRVSFIGSSIAMNGANFHYVNLFYATRYPSRKVYFLNRGISGDVTDEIIGRMESDILIGHPTWAVLMLEENDLRPALYYKARQDEPGIREKRQKGLENWFKNADSIAQKLRQAGIKVILQTPTIYDQTGNLPAENAYGLNDSLKRCVIYLKQLAGKYNLPFVDCWTVLNNVNKKIQRNDLTQTIIGTDRVHVSHLGHFIMAYQFLKTQDALKKVSHIIIDAKCNILKQQFNCSVFNLKKNSGNLSFTYTGKSLPFPSPEGLNVDSLLPFTKEMNADSVQVQGLARGNYRLLIDTFIAGTFSNIDFKKGINLSKNHTTPQYQQALAVLRLFDEYWKIERTLRIIKYVEYAHISRFKNKGNMEEIKEGFTAVLDRSKTDANYNFFKNVFEIYSINKPQEKNLELKSKSILEEVYLKNAPLQHTYKIERTAD